MLFLNLVSFREIWGDSASLGEKSTDQIFLLDENGVIWLVWGNFSYPIILDSPTDHLKYIEMWSGAKIGVNSGVRSEFLIKKKSD